MAWNKWKSTLQPCYDVSRMGDHTTTRRPQLILNKLPCVCLVIDHRWRQNVVRTKKWHTRRSRVCYWCSYRILTSSVIYYWTDARQLGIYLIYIIKKSFNNGVIYTSVLQIVPNTEENRQTHFCKLHFTQNIFQIYFWTYKDTLIFESTQDSALSKSSEVKIFETKNWTKNVLPATGVISFI